MNERLRTATARLQRVLSEQAKARWPEDPAQLPEWKEWWAASLAEAESAQMDVVSAALEEFAALEPVTAP